jgi:hypothetical protein
MFKGYDTTCCRFHNFVRNATIVSLLMRVSPSLEGMIPLLSLRVIYGESFTMWTSQKVDPKACLVAKSDLGWLWHHRLAHVGMRNLAKLQKDEHILGLTSVVFEKDRLCSACQAGKQAGAHHPTKNILSSSRPLKLLHMDLFGPIAYIRW